MTIGFKHTHVFILGLLFLATLSVNLTKAIHIDDTAYLEMAQAIINDPLHPLSQTINWHNTQQPIFVLNQPPLLSYYLALIIIIFGDSEIALHISWSIFSLASIILFYLLIGKNKVNSLFLTSLFALSPAFLPGQNLMFDVPLISLWLLFFGAILAAREDESKSFYFWAGWAVALALLVKYTSLVLIVIFIIVIVYRCDWKSAWYLLIPFGVIILWSAFNYYDIGAIHILGRNVLTTLSGQQYAYRMISVVAGLGLIAPSALMFLWPRKTNLLEKIFLGCLALASLGIFLFIINQGYARIHAVVWAILFGQGIIFLLFGILIIYRQFTMLELKHRRKETEKMVILSLWITGTIAFIVQFAPFLALRHVLLILPPVLLLLGDFIEQNNIGGAAKVTVLIITALLGLIFSISDYHYADLNREYAVKIKSMLPTDAHIWQVGHWGWQWYAKKQGMLQYDLDQTELHPGDYLITPEFIDRQEIVIPAHLSLQYVGKLEVPDSFILSIQTLPLYSYSFPEVPPLRVEPPGFSFSIQKVVSAPE
ncbi:MAG: glycosyltransferase family 39 protein [Anaerolineae bacterium]|nr:glycosyltransferase family 39 protein [Anaerolineae bacterium]